LTASKEEAGSFNKDGEEIKLGIPEQLRQMAAMIIPLGRPATPEEAAGPVFFLCSPWADYIHGQVLNVTGGQFGGMTT
jgi:3-oxoacyl-[acyl-carrier protein] reductase